MLKKYLIPLLLILIISLVLPILDTILTGEFFYNIMIIIRAITYFTLGVYLNTNKRGKYQSWLLKIVISFIFVLLLLMQLNISIIHSFISIVNTLGISGFIYYLFYIYLGWCFFN